MKGIREPLVHGMMGLVGVICGALSAIALMIAAIIPAILGLLAFLLSPLRAVLDRLRRAE